METAQALVADIPEYKQKIENLKAAEAGKVKLGKACEELNDLQIKQILLEASQKEQMAALLSSDRKQGRMSMEHRTRLLKKTLEETVSTLVQEGDRERQELEERKLQLWEENEQMIEEHFKEEETLRLQISNAKEMERLRQYYETKLKEMGDELAALEQEGDANIYPDNAAVQEIEEQNNPSVGRSSSTSSQDSAV